MLRLYSVFLVLAVLTSAAPAFSEKPQPTTAGSPKATPQDSAQDTPSSSASTAKKSTAHWRKDPTIRRRPGSYLGGGMGYSQGHVWYAAQEADATTDSLYFGPAHCSHLFLRVGDAFVEWFALGFQINIVSTINQNERLSAFGLLLDTTFYPWRGLGIRPSVGLGFAYVDSRSSNSTGFGWPADVSLTITYEIRITRHFVIAPFVQTYWITGKDFDGLFYCFGIEFLRWFKTATG